MSSIGPRSASAFAWLLAFAGTAAACNAILGIDYGEPKKLVDAGSDASLEASPSDAADDESSSADVAQDDTPGDVASCIVRWPSAPKRDDDPPESGARDVQFTVAAETLRIKRTETLGFDLDGRCTCPDMEPDSCRRSPDHSAATNCDGPGGRDVVGNTFLQTWVTYGLSALSEEALNRDLESGRAGALVRVSGYNGLANDQLVSAEFFGQAWMQSEGGARTPAHDGTDVWTVYDGSLMIGATSVESDPVAYVSEHVLVAQLKVATVALRPNTGAYDNALVLELRDAVLTGTIAEGDRGYELTDAHLAGRWPVGAALSSFTKLADVDSGRFICEDHPLFPFLQQYVCAEADIMSRRSADNTGGDCDAVSFAFGFDATPARVGATMSPPMVPSTCAGSKPSCPNRDR